MWEFIDACWIPQIKMQHTNAFSGKLMSINVGRHKTKTIDQPTCRQTQTNA